MSVTLLDKWRLLQAIIVDPELPASAVKVAAVLLDYLHCDTDLCCPSYDTVATRSRFTKRGVIKAVRALEDVGWVRIARGQHGLGRGGVNEFQFDFRRLETASERVNGETPFVGQKGERKDTQTPQGKVNEKTPIKADKGERTSTLHAGKRVNGTGRKGEQNGQKRVNAGSPESEKGIREGNRESVPSSLRSDGRIETAPPNEFVDQTPTATDILLGNALVWVMQATDLNEKPARTLIGRWRKLCGRDDELLLDILRAAKRETYGNPTGWVEMAIGKRTQRKTAKPAEEQWEGTALSIWRLNIEGFRNHRIWTPSLGPSPVEQGFRGPPALLKEFGFEEAA